MMTLTRNFPLRRGQRGFTLIELMIAVAIVGILVKLAYPAYTQSVKKSRRADAKTALLDLAQREERYMSTTNVYATAASDAVKLGYPTGTTFPMNVLTGNAASYTLTVTGTASTFTATAAPTGKQVGDTCGSYALDNTGAQTVSGGTLTAADCW